MTADRSRSLPLPEYTMFRATVAALAAVSALVVLPGCAVGRGQSTVGQYVDDTAITTAVKALSWRPGCRCRPSASKTLNGTVMLAGFIKNATRARRIAGPLGQQGEGSPVGRRPDVMMNEGSPRRSAVPADRRAFAADFVRRMAAGAPRCWWRLRPPSAWTMARLALAGGLGEAGCPRPARPRTALAPRRGAVYGNCRWQLSLIGPLRYRRPTWRASRPVQPAAAANRRRKACRRAGRCMPAIWTCGCAGATCWPGVAASRCACEQVGISPHRRAAQREGRRPRELAARARRHCAARPRPAVQISTLWLREGRLAIDGRTLACRPTRCSRSTGAA